MFEGKKLVYDGRVGRYEGLDDLNILTNKLL
jgi:hypothetical protein